jgi:hypothetical protein
MGKSALLANWSNRYSLAVVPFPVLSSLLMNIFTRKVPPTPSRKHPHHAFRGMFACILELRRSRSTRDARTIGASARHFYKYTKRYTGYNRYFLSPFKVFTFNTVDAEEFPRFLEETLAKNKRNQLVLIIDGLDIYIKFWILNILLLTIKK